MSSAVASGHVADLLSIVCRGGWRVAELFESSLGGACGVGAFRVPDLLLHWQRHLPRLFPHHAGSHDQVHRAPVCGLADPPQERFPRLLRLCELSVRAGRGHLCGS